MLRPFVAAALIALSACSDYEIIGGDDQVTPGDERTGSIRGRVCGPDGEHWVVGAEVIVDHSSGNSIGTTDDEGWFQLDGVPVGEWDVVVRKGSFEVTIPVTVVEGQVTEIPEGQCIEQGDVKIAVVEGDWDAVEHILGAMSLEYDMIDYWGTTAFLRDPARLSEYDIVFFNCGMDDSWEWYYEAEVAQNLRDFVAGGGSIYASDWAYYIVEAGWPSMNTFQGDDTWLGDARVGETGLITADVLDPVMAQRLGSDTARLNFDLPAWVVMAQTHQGDILIEGQATWLDPITWATRTAQVPLTSRLVEGDGAVVYTSFHNEAQTTLDMTLLLQEIVLSL